MKYAVKFEKPATKSLSKLPIKEIEKIKIEVLKLSDNPRPFGYKKLKGRDAYRIRVGDYRVI